MAAGGQSARQRHEGAQLGAPFPLSQLAADFGRGQARVARGAAQAHDLRQHVDTRLRLLLRLRERACLCPGGRALRGLARRLHARQRGFGLGLRLPAQRFVVRGFHRFGLDPDHQLRARRQFVEHLGLGPAQHEGRDHAAQALAGLAHAAALDRVGEMLVEAGQRAQQARVAEAHHRP
ncbi:hypothetical protein FQZ97_607910 [compost metagenome]